MKKKDKRTINNRYGVTSTVGSHYRAKGRARGGSCGSTLEGGDLGKISNHVKKPTYGRKREKTDSIQKRCCLSQRKGKGPQLAWEIRINGN